MNPMAILKGSKFFVIAALVGYGLWFVNDYRNDQAAVRDALITANADAVSAKAQAQTFATANAQLEAITETQAEALRQASVAMTESAERFRAIEETQQAQTEVLEGQRLQNAIRGKRTLVERLANRATKERFDEVESIFNED